MEKKGGLVGTFAFCLGRELGKGSGGADIPATCMGFQVE